MANNLYGSNWTDARIERLKELAAADMPAREIAGILGFTRNSVLGKCFRLGIKREKIARPERAAPIDPQVKRQREIDRARRQQASKLPQERKAVERTPPPPFAGFLKKHFDELRSFSAIEPNQCRFPEGDSAPFLYCGTETLAGQPYCAHHHKIAHSRHIKITEADRERRKAHAAKVWFGASIKLKRAPAEAA